MNNEMVYFRYLFALDFNGSIIFFHGVAKFTLRIFSFDVLSLNLEHIFF